MTTLTATYSPDDNKLRLYASSRLDAETYQRVKAAGFKWAPKQDLFVAPAWSPGREDLLIELCGEIDDEDTSLADRAEQRAERFGEYSEKRGTEAESARKAVAAIADNIPLGQPILVGHHSEKHARKDAQRIESGMRKAVKLWETSGYWKSRAAGAIRHAKYRELPSVRARRIKKLEAERRKVEKGLKSSEAQLRGWRSVMSGEGFSKKDGGETTPRERALFLANVGGYMSFCFPLADYPREAPASQYEGAMSLWSALEDGIVTAEQAVALVVPRFERSAANAARWLVHLDNRLTYERAMMEDAGGLPADRVKPEKGGACKCLWAPRHGWAYIQRVNKVTVSVLSNYGNGGRNFLTKVNLDKISALMTAAEVQAARDAGRLQETQDGTGFYLLDTPAPEPTKPAEPEPNGEQFDAMKAALKDGVRVTVAPQLFPTPAEIAARVVEFADIEPGQLVLEPSAGTGALLKALPEGHRAHAVEINEALAQGLRERFPHCPVACRDFLEIPASSCAFDRIVMNPPFQNGADIKHIRHALTFLKPGGRLVAICANGPRQQEQLQAIATHWEDLPAGAFKEQGTGVSTAIVVIDS